MATKAIYRGVFPVAPTVFDTNGELDLEGQKRCTDFMIDAGSQGMCILANWSEQFVLTDNERERVMDCVLAHVAGRVPVIVTTTHFGSQICAERSRRAEAAGFGFAFCAFAAWPLEVEWRQGRISGPTAGPPYRLTTRQGLHQYVTFTAKILSAFARNSRSIEWLKPNSPMFSAVRRPTRTPSRKTGRVNPSSGFTRPMA